MTEMGIAPVIVVAARGQHARGFDGAGVVVGCVSVHARVGPPAERAAWVAALVGVGAVQERILVVGLVAAVLCATLLVFVV